MRRRARALVLAVLGLAACVSCVSPAPGPLEPLVVGWERFFTLEWQVDRSRQPPRVWGYLFNDWGLPAGRVRILIDGVGPDGELLGQQLAWIGLLMPGTRVYFEVPAERSAPEYRVRVFAYDWILDDGFGNRRRWR